MIADQAKDKAIAALRAYLHCGEEALKALEDDKFDEYIARLDHRRVVFANFRALDHLAMTHGVDLAVLPEVKDIWRSIQTVNQVLTDISEHTLGGMEEQYSRLSVGRSISLKYGNGTFLSPRLKKLG